MTTTIISAFISGMLVLAGVFITGLIALIGYYIKTNQEIKKERLSRHFDHRMKVYEMAFEFASNFYQSGKQEITKKVQQINKDLIFVASPEVYLAFHEIFDNSADKLLNRGFNDDQIKEIQTNTAKTFFIAIRKDLYPNQKELKPEEIRFIAEKGAIVEN